MFHLLVGQALQRLIPTNQGPCAVNLARRYPSHTQLRALCSSLIPQGRQKAGLEMPRAWREAGFDGVVGERLERLARGVANLQILRETADYNLGASLGPVDAHRQLADAAEVFELVEQGLPEPQWTLFLVALLLGQRRA